MEKSNHIAINLPFTPISRAVMRGIRSYFEPGPQWTFEVRSHQDAATCLWIKTRCQGVITYAGTLAWHESILKTGVPCVVITSTVNHVPLPSICEDHRGVGRQVAEEFLRRGFRTLGICSAERVSSGARAEGFVEVSEKAGHRVHLYSERSQVDAETSLAGLRQWLRELPKPAAVFAVTDSRGTLVLEACRREDIAVPEELVVVAVGNDVEVCNFCYPPMSSVAIPFEAMGRAAAELLYGLMRGDAAPASPIVISPQGIVTRRSSEATVVSDPVVAEASRYIVEHACDPIGVEDVARHTGYSYRRLHERFQEAGGRSLHGEIRRVQLNRAKLMLTETDVPIYEVAKACGWGTAKQIDRIFKRHEGMAPAAYRRRFRSI
jgi:LacI family transcriptional regulator